MGFLKPTDTVRIELSELDPDYADYWVDVRSQLTRAEKRGVERVAFGGGVEIVGGQGGEMGGRMAPDMVGVQDATLVESIVAWNLTDEHDQPLPVQPREALYDSLSRLPDTVFDFLYRRASLKTKARTKEEQARFPGGPDAGVEGGQGGTAGAGPVLDAGGTVAAAGTPA